MAVRFVAVGELLVDVIAAGADHDAGIRVRPAGSAFNAAVAAAAAGADATVVGTVGDDPAGRMILAELAARRVRSEVTVAGGATGTFLLADGEIRVDRGVGHDLVLPERLEAWVALDAARLSSLPPEGNAVIANEAWEGRLDELALGRRLACMTLGARGAVAILDGHVEEVAPARRLADAPGSGDAFAATLLVALEQGDDLSGALARATRAALDSLA
jgi:sugar/nucleoside kinase (ribokinase family)